MRLQGNEETFSSNISGKPHEFVLGSADVMRCWNIGVANMKKGSKRRLTCQVQSAFGDVSVPSFIPENATLVFDVELVDVEAI